MQDPLLERLSENLHYKRNATIYIPYPEYNSDRIDPQFAEIFGDFSFLIHIGQ